MFIRLVQNRCDFYVRKEGKFVVFTGSLSSMTRKRAQALVTDVGWKVQHTVTKQTTLLVVGYHQTKLTDPLDLSRKKLTALGLKREGQKLQLISEKEFLQKIKETIDQLYQNVI
ncbi:MULTISPECIES: BRCT domain-containing protein [Enterococcus]|uniref:BRCT domain-containing protein n=1 Tax=Enterococcus TaxID=1350 RepID=UPI002954B6BD|nr:BRCT domain-containing protein [Enterococcus gallinarum]MDY4072572.1 BRCT domain-containing protein [Enterococcus gallinarum]